MKTAPKKATRIKAGRIQRANYKWIYLFLLPTIVIFASLTSRIAMYEQIALTTSGGPGDDTMSLPIILVKGIMDYRYGYANAVGVVMFIIGLIVLGVVNKLFRMDEANY